ncbi:MAG: DUF2802 domain-containing protein [Gammaproteobacteria bacterium]|nr:DUF2802 domain-containing protein [Gammaproteobacteria bacterium]
MVALLATTQILMLIAVAGLAHFAYQRDKQRSNMIAEMQSDMAALCEGALGITDHLERVEIQQRRLVAKQEREDIHGSTEHSYNQAIKLVQQGADIESLMSRCGLVLEEAELIVMLHRLKKDAA